MTVVNLGVPVLGKNPQNIPVSNSEIRTYKECRRKWYLAYYRGLTPKRQRSSGALALGTRVHKALELYYADNQDPVAVFHQLAEEARLTLLEHEYDTTELDKENELGRVMLEGYIEWLAETGADVGLEVISAEQKLSAKVTERVELVGKLDMRMRRGHDGVRLMVDHKTAASFDVFNKTAHMDEQVKTYLLLESLQTDDDTRCDGALFNLLRKVKRTGNAKPPFYERIEVRHNRVAMEDFWYRLQGVLRDMVSTRDALDAGHSDKVVAYPNPTRDCSWKCQFYYVCPLMDDGSAAEEMITDLYEVDDPYSRYEEEMDGSPSV